MEQQPADVNLAQLQRFLGKSKMVMEATKVPVPGGGNTANNNTRQAPAPVESYSNDGMAEKPIPDMQQMLAAKGYIQPTLQAPPLYDETMMYEEAVENSKLPPHIKKLMAEQRIQPPVIPNGAPIPQAAMAAMNRQIHGPGSTAPKPQQMNERVQAPAHTGNIGFTREEMKGMIKECLSELMMESITETAVKSTLKKLMTEGRLKVKQ